jgi:6-phosphogluconolactonase
MHDLVICENPNVLAFQAANTIEEIARDAVGARGRFSIALCGGATPEKTYFLLAQPKRMESIDWSKTFVFFSDERFVPHGDSRSNYGLAQQAMLSHVPIPAENVFPVPTDWSNAANAAKEYSQSLMHFFQPNEPEQHSSQPNVPETPRFDLILLGLGEDGHTASLFPGSAALHVEDACVTWSLPGVLPPPVDRITFTYPLLNAARNALFLVAGEQKAAALKAVLEGDVAREINPAVGVQPKEGRLTWLIDRPAANKLSPSFIERYATVISNE